MRAIDVLKYLLAKAESEVPEGHRIVGVNVPVDIVREIIDEQPERKKGHWIRVDDDRISGRCSVCGWESHLYEDDVVGMNFCPNCGAKLEGEKE